MFAIRITDTLTLNVLSESTSHHNQYACMVVVEIREEDVQ